MTVSPPLVVRVEELSYHYLAGTPLEVHALRGVSLQVHAREIVGLVGPTGSGKSTLLQHLNGLLRPQQGEVWVLGRSLSDAAVDIRAARQQVGLLFQNPEDQLFERYAGDDVAFGPRNLGLKPQEVRERVRQAMETVGLPFEFKDRLTAGLSQGQRRRLAVAGVLAMEPQILALDEPTAGLDPLGKSKLLETLLRWAGQGERAIVLALHNMDEVAALCDCVYLFAQGQIVGHGSPRQIFGDAEMVLRHGLSLPAPAEAIRRLRERGCPLPSQALTVDEAADEISRLLHARAL